MLLRLLMKNQFKRRSGLILIVNNERLILRLRSLEVKLAKEDVLRFIDWFSTKEVYFDITIYLKCYFMLWEFAKGIANVIRTQNRFYEKAINDEVCRKLARFIFELLLKRFLEEDVTVLRHEYLLQFLLRIPKIAYWRAFRIKFKLESKIKCDVEYVNIWRYPVDKWLPMYDFRW